MTACLFKCSCPTPELELLYNHLEFEELKYTVSWHETDTIFPEQLGFKVVISDTTYLGEHYYSYHQHNKIRPLFKGAYAFSPCLCPPFKNPQIESIEIETLLPINENYPSHSIVSDLFFMTRDISTEKGLYYTLNEGISISNAVDTQYEYYQLFQFYCNVPIKNDSAQFVLTFNLENNRCVCDTTPIFEIFTTKH